jgi:hypothetical protein
MLLVALMDGNMAEVRRDFMVVAFIPFDVTVLVEVNSVTIVCAIANDVAIIKLAQTASFLIIYFPYIVI